MNENNFSSSVCTISLILSTENKKKKSFFLFSLEETISFFFPIYMKANTFPCCHSYQMTKLSLQLISQKLFFPPWTSLMCSEVGEQVLKTVKCSSLVLFPEHWTTDTFIKQKMLSCTGRKKCSSHRRKSLSFKALFPRLTLINHLTESAGTPKHTKKNWAAKAKEHSCL